MHKILFVKSKDNRLGEDELVSLLSASLKQGKVLWLVSGGSNVNIESSIMSKLEPGLTKQLSIMLTDERYGPEWHEDSNFRQLITAGFNPKDAYFPHVLKGDLDAGSTLSDYITTFDYLRADSRVIGQFGIGDDGHIAGILPGSEGTRSKELICYYETPTFKRLTLTFEAIKTVDIARAFCFGNNKLEALQKLQAGQATTTELPSMVLNDLEDVKVYNDQI